MNQATFMIFNADSLGNEDIKRERYYDDTIIAQTPVDTIDQTLPDDFATLIEEQTDIAAVRIIKLESDFVAMGPHVGDGIIGVAIVRPENPPVYTERR